MRALARGVVADKDSGALRAASEGAGSSQLNFSARCARDFFLSGEGLGRGVVTDKDSGALRATSEGAGSSQLNFWARCARDFFLSGEGLGPRRRHRQRFWRPACGVGGRRVVTVKFFGALRARLFFFIL